MLTATIASGHADAADLFFLLAVILAVVAAVLVAARSSLATVLAYVALGATALGLLLL